MYVLATLTAHLESRMRRVLCSIGCSRIFCTSIINKFIQ